MTKKIDTRYLFRLTDDTGMFQHAVFGIPDPSEGYTADDNARASILAAMLYERSPESKYEELLIRYLSFLIYAEKGRWFRNFMSYSHRFLEKRGSEDSFGRCLFALGYLTSRSRLPAYIRACAEKLLRRTYTGCSSLTFPKSKAYALVGLTLWNQTESRPQLTMLRDSLADTYLQVRREDWHWFEEKMTYCSGIFPLAILCAFSDERIQAEIGLESLDFLTETTFRGNIFSPIGCKGWFERGGTPARYDQQPVEACSTMLALLKAFQLTGNENYQNRAQQCFQWYLGGNAQHLLMIDTETGGCRDGLTEHGPNENEGAESLVCWLISALTAEKQGWLSKPGTAAPSAGTVVWL
jgi:hypothetical protein